MKRFKLQNRYQDSGWENLELSFDKRSDAIDEAIKLSKDSICFGMVRVIDLLYGHVVETFPAGG